MRNETETETEIESDIETETETDSETLTPPIKTETIQISKFDPINGQVTIDMNKDEFKNDVIYNIELTDDINEILIDNKENKNIVFVLPPDKQELTIDSTNESSSSFDIIPQSNITINLGENTFVSIPNATGTITLNNKDNQALNLNKVSPNSESFTLVPNVPIKINEINKE